MRYYTEPIVYEDNLQGRPRMTSVLADIVGMEVHGFDGTGSPRGATRRVWASEIPLPPWAVPASVTSLSAANYALMVSGRSRAPTTKPAPELTFTVRVRAALLKLGVAVLAPEVE